MRRWRGRWRGLCSTSPANELGTVADRQSEPGVPENQDVVFFLSVDDPDGDVVTITVGNSPDGQFFTLDTGTGEIRSTQLFDFETPLDANGDNVYEQSVTLSDGTNTSSQIVRVTITNVDEPPTCVPIPATAIDENTTGVLATLAGTDPDAGDEANAVFEDLMVLDARVDGSVAIDPATGVVSLTTPLDAEAFEENFSFEVTANYRTNNLFDRCSVVVSLNDLPAQVTSGILLTDNRQPVELLGDLDGGGTADWWIADEPNLIASGPVSGTVVLGETLSAALQTDGAATIDVATLAAAEAIRVSGTFDIGIADATSISALSISDLDGDGRDELLVMSAQPPNDGLDPARRPWGHVVFSATIAANTSGAIDLDTLAPADGFSLTGPVDFNGGTAAYAVGDLDGIAGDELVIALPEAIGTGAEQGLLFVVDGATLDAASGNLDFDLTAATRRFDGPFDVDPAFVVGVPDILGDLSGDGTNELVVQSGMNAAIVPSANLIASAGGALESLNPLLLGLNGDFAGRVDSADIDNDGADDLLIVRGDGAAGSEHASIAFGAALQPLVATNSTVPLDDANFAAGQYLGITSNGIGATAEPITLTRIGDLDNDGRDEVAYGQLNDANNDPGSIYILRGSVLAGQTGTSFDIDSFSAADGTRIAPVPFVFTSLSTKLSLAPDVDGDGHPELYVTSNQRLQTDPDGVGIVILSTDVRSALANNEADVDIEALFFNESP